MPLAIHTTHIPLLEDEADLLAYLFERDLKWYHAALSLNGNKGKVCDDLIRRINASRAVGVPPLDLYEAIDEALKTSTCAFLRNFGELNFDIKAVPMGDVQYRGPTIKVIKQGEETKRVFVVRKYEKKLDYEKVERLARIWQTDTQLARWLNMDRKVMVEKMLTDSQFREAVERGRSGRSRGDNA